MKLMLAVFLVSLLLITGVLSQESQPTSDIDLVVRVSDLNNGKIAETEHYKVQKPTFTESQYETFVFIRDKDTGNQILIDKKLSELVDGFIFERLGEEKFLKIKLKNPLNGKTDISIPLTSKLELRRLGNGLMIVGDNLFQEFKDDFLSATHYNPSGELRKYQSEMKGGLPIFIILPDKSIFLVDNVGVAKKPEVINGLISDIKTTSELPIAIILEQEGDSIVRKMVDLPEGTRFRQGREGSFSVVYGSGNELNIKTIVNQKQFIEEVLGRLDGQVQDFKPSPKIRIQGIGEVSSLEVGGKDQTTLNKLKMKFFVADSGRFKGKRILYDDLTKKAIIEMGEGKFYTFGDEGELGLAILGEESKKAVKILNDYVLENGELVYIRPPKLVHLSTDSVNNRLLSQLDYLGKLFSEGTEVTETYEDLRGSKEYQVVRTNEGDIVITQRGQKYAFLYASGEKKWKYLDYIREKLVYKDLDFDDLSTTEKQVITDSERYQVPNFEGYTIGTRDLDLSKSDFKLEIKDKAGNVVGYYIGGLSMKAFYIDLGDKRIELGGPRFK